MLCINHLTGFGSVTGSKAGVLSASYVRGVASITIAEPFLDFTVVDPVPYVNNKTYLVAMAADNSGTLGVSSFDFFNDGGVVGFTPARIHTTQDPGAANAGVTLAAACEHYTGATGDGPLSVDFVNPVEPAVKAAFLLEISDTLAGTTQYVSATSNAGNGTAPTVSADLLAGDLMVGLFASESRTAPTADGGTGWSARVGTIADTTVAGTSITIHAQTYLCTIDETKTWSPTCTTRDYVIGCIVLRPAA